MPKIIAVMSGKGGVGKSSVSAMLAKVLSEKARTIILDFDICGPSLSRALKIEGSLIKAEKGFKPIQITDNLFALSIGVSLKAEDAVIWRGPRKKVFLNLFYDSIDDYDFVVIDTPPGVSEEHEFIAQKGASVLVVSTPQNMALNDAQRCIEFCIKNNLNILGLVENMSSLLCECCNEIFYPFGKGGGKLLAEEYKIEFLGSLRIEPEWSQQLDDGTFNEKYKSLAAYEFFKILCDREDIFSL